MIDLHAALTGLVADCRSLLADAGVSDPVVTDPDAVTPPCVYVHLAAVTGFGLASYDMEGTVDVVAPNIAADAAVRHLSRMAGPLVDGLPHTGESQFVQLATGGGGAPYPTLRIKALISQP